MPVQIVRYLSSVSLVFAAACSSTDHETKVASDGGAETVTGTAPLTLAATCTDDLDTVVVPPAELSKYDAAHRGEVVRCAPDRAFSIKEIKSTLEADQFLDVDVRSSVRVYQVAYRTDRLVGEEGLTTALVFLPDRPIAAHPPVVVAAHGFIGTSDACRFSREFPLTTGDVNAKGMMLALSGFGYPVVAPDYPGWGVAGAAATVFSSDDEAHSVLDGTRALHQLLAPGATSDQVVLVGHSQGGHAVLSAQALAGSYGLEGRIVATVSFAPLWLPVRVWGAVLSPAAGFTTANNAQLIGLAMYYFNTHANLYDGPDANLALYQADTRDAVAKLADPSAPCIADVPEGARAFSTKSLSALGATTSDFFDPEFLASVGLCGITGDPNCSTEPAKTWIERFRADRPKSDPNAGDILLWQGGQDELATPAFSKCAIDKITSDLREPAATARLSVCGDRTADHNAVLRNIPWTARWIASRTLGSPEPEDCAGIEALQPQDGGTLACPAVPGNVD